MHADLFNQPINIGSKLLVPINNRIRVCEVVKMNRKSIVVVEIAYKNGTEFRTLPNDTIVLSGEDLTILTLRGSA